MKIRRKRREVVKRTGDNIDPVGKKEEAEERERERMAESFHYNGFIRC